MTNIKAVIFDLGNVVFKRIPISEGYTGMIDGCILLLNR